MIVCGLPGSGKSTLARLLEHRLGAVRFSADDWLEALKEDKLDSAARTRVESLQWDLARRLLELGGAVVIEWGTWARSERDALRFAARRVGAAVELRYVQAPFDELWRRVRDRDSDAGLDLGRRPITYEDMLAWAAQFEPPTPGERALYDPPITRGGTRGRGPARFRAAPRTVRAASCRRTR